ncbi:hypothetical protein Gotur_009566 [Gossypium turneri]
MSSYAPFNGTCWRTRDCLAYGTLVGHIKDSLSHSEARVSEVCLAEFLSYGPQREEGKERKCLLRKTDDGKIVKWDVETNDSLCTLEEAFQKVELSLGFNIELKFDDNVVYRQRHLVHVLQLILQAINVCLEGGFQGIVSEIKGVFENPGAVPKIKDSNLSLLTYGTLK